jgi:hypothetical protein
MWGIALGIAAFALAAYELFTREPRAAGALKEGAAQGGKLFMGAVKDARERAAALSCQLEADDLDRTRAWVSENLGPAVDLRTGLTLMPARRPPIGWPDYVQRTACYLSRAGE